MKHFETMLVLSTAHAPAPAHLANSDEHTHILMANQHTVIMHIGTSAQPAEDLPDWAQPIAEYAWAHSDACYVWFDCDADVLPWLPQYEW